MRPYKQDFGLKSQYRPEDDISPFAFYVILTVSILGLVLFVGEITGMTDALISSIAQ